MRRTQKLTAARRIRAAQRANERAMLAMVKRHAQVRGAYHVVSLNTASWNALERLVRRGLVLRNPDWQVGGYVPRTPLRRQGGGR